MPERVYVNGNTVITTSTPNWGSLWAGAFGFLAIWSIFGVLGAAIFASVSRGTAGAIQRASVPMGIWAVVLTIIAMYVAGHIAGSRTVPTAAWTTGTVVFGLSLTASIIVATLIGILGLGATSAGSAIAAFRAGMVADLGWVAFVAMILGWLGAVAGAMSSRSRQAVENVSPEQVHRAAA